MGDAATTAASPALCCSCGWLFHGSIGDRLCDRGRPAIAGGRPRASVEILTLSPLPLIKGRGGLTRNIVLSLNMNDATPVVNVAIVGRPNVGKSALFNRLVGRKIAIVHDQPGITRDRISAICKRGARPFTVWDTGGMAVPQSRDALSVQVRRAAEGALRDSDLLLPVADANAGLSPIDEDLARMLRKSQ